MSSALRTIHRENNTWKRSTKGTQHTKDVSHSNPFAVFAAKMTKMADKRRKKKAARKAGKS